MAGKVLTIVDCYVSSDTIQNTLVQTLDGLNDHGFEIMLSSSHPIPEEVQKRVKYSFFDSRNQLYEYEDYVYTQPWNFFINCGDFMAHNFITSFQRHGLSVMCNLFNSLRLAKSLGYTHFQKILYDVELTADCFSFLESVPKIVESEGKKGLVYYNDEKILNSNHWNDIPDMSGAYFYMEIDHFLDKIPSINSEETYRKVLMQNFGNLTFLTFERFLYLFFTRNGDTSLHIRRGSQYPKDFNGIKESKEISHLNFSKKYHGLFSRVLRIENSDNFVILSNNFSGERQFRKFHLFDENNNFIEEFNHDPNPSCWQMYYLSREARSMNVYKDDLLIFSEKLPDSCIGHISNF